MKNALFYIATVLIWGSTWIGIKMQLGIVDPMVSVAYRFSLAAIIFSTILLMNIFNGALFDGQPIEKRVLAGGGLGLIGILLVFSPEISSFSLGQTAVIGILLCTLATLLASLGNITSARNQRNGLPILQTNAYGMTYGAAAMLFAAVCLGKPFVVDLSATYLSSLLYLAVFGSIIAFGCYLTLVGNIGADRAAYATLLFPIVALGISTIWEGYTWTSSSIAGVILILSGNVYILKKKQSVASR